jgi:hypothetical protein
MLAAYGTLLREPRHALHVLFEGAPPIARKQEAKSWELRAATSVARVCDAVRAERMKRAIFLRGVASWARGARRYRSRRLMEEEKAVRGV